jgi:hypothetical protein
MQASLQREDTLYCEDLVLAGGAGLCPLTWMKNFSSPSHRLFMVSFYIWSMKRALTGTSSGDGAPAHL